MRDAPSVFKGSRPDVRVFFTLGLILDDPQTDVGQMFFRDDASLAAETKVIVPAFVGNRHVVAWVMRVCAMAKKDFFLERDRFAHVYLALALEIVQLSARDRGYSDVNNASGHA